MPSRPVVREKQLEALRGLHENHVGPIRFYLRVHYNFDKEVDITGEDGRDPFLFDLLNMEFGLRWDEVRELTMPQLHALLRFDHRLRTARTDALRQGVLIEIAKLREDLAVYPNLPDGDRLFLKALRYRFPDPDEPGEQAPRGSGRRGRQKGRNYVNAAIAELTYRTIHGGKIDIPNIATAVGCTEKNLRNSKKFVDIHRSLMCHFTEPTYGEKGKDGRIEVYGERQPKRRGGVRHF
jgi:hypothetical protein